MRNANSPQLYNANFYRATSDEGYFSATVILPLAIAETHPTTILDVGCGSGYWVAAAKDAGIAHPVGIDGPWIRNHPPFRNGLDLRVQDLEQRLAIKERFDLAICLEVAEHLTRDRAATLVEDLCGVADAILFSAAIPQQPGINHINCRWQSYWASIFEKHGRIPLDIVRPKIWGRSDIPYWYQQNTLLYVSDDRATRQPATMLDIAHPVLLQYLREYPSLRTIVKDFPGALLRAAQQRNPFRTS